MAKTSAQVTLHLSEDVQRRLRELLQARKADGCPQYPRAEIEDLIVYDLLIALQTYDFKTPAAALPVVESFCERAKIPDGLSGTDLLDAAFAYFARHPVRADLRTAVEAVLREDLKNPADAKAKASALAFIGATGAGRKSRTEDKAVRPGVPLLQFLAETINRGHR